MAITYAAHVITPDAHEVGDPEIMVITWGAENSENEAIATYPWDDDAEPVDVLAANGWHARQLLEELPGYGYFITVEPADWEHIVKHVTIARHKAEIEHERQDTAWRYVIQDAMERGGSATKLAAAAAISRERVYQIRDGRR